MENNYLTCTTATRSRFVVPSFRGALVGDWSMTKHGKQIVTTGVVPGVPVWSPPHC